LKQLLPMSAVCNQLALPLFGMGCQK